MSSGTKDLIGNANFEYQNKFYEPVDWCTIIEAGKTPDKSMSVL